MKRAIFLLTPFLAIACGNPYTIVPIASMANVSADWTELVSAKPLVWAKLAQEVELHIDSPHQRDLELRIVGPDGQKSVPDVELVATDGRTFSMDVHGFLNEDMFFTRQTPVPVPIRAIRIRNGFPIRVSNVRWVGYDPANVKR
jgi:hypothetical protein